MFVLAVGAMLVTFASAHADGESTACQQSGPTIQRSTVRVRFAPFNPITVSTAKPAGADDEATIRPRQDHFPTSADSEPVDLPKLPPLRVEVPPVHVSDVPTAADDTSGGELGILAAHEGRDGDEYEHEYEHEHEHEYEYEYEYEYGAGDDSAAATFFPESSPSSPASLLPRAACEVAIHGPSLCFRQREAIYEVRVGEIPDTLPGTISVVCVLPAGMQLTVVSRTVEFDGQNNRIFWRPAGTSSGGDSLFLKIRAVTKGEKTMRVSVLSGDETIGQGEHLTTVIARPTVDEFID